jgi:hypothetical protein
MHRELVLSSFVAAGWLSLCFLVFGTLFSLSAVLLGPGAFFSFLDSLGTIHLGPSIQIERVSLLMYGACMVLACIPVNYYWLKREADRERTDLD